MDHCYIMYCSGHAMIYLMKETVTLLLAKFLVVDRLSLTIVVNFGELFCYLIFDSKSIKEMSKYTRSIHQLRHWSQELVDYSFSIVHSSTAMMKDGDTLFRKTQSLIHQYLVITSTIRCNNLKSWPFAYNYDMFYSYSNPRHIQASTTMLNIFFVSSDSMYFVVIYVPVDCPKILYSS